VSASRSVWIACLGLGLASPALAAGAAPRGRQPVALPANSEALYVASLGEEVDDLLSLATLGVNRCTSLEIRGLSGRVLGDLRAFSSRLKRYAAGRGIDLDRVVAAVHEFERRVRGSRDQGLVAELSAIQDAAAFDRAYLASLEPALSALTTIIETGSAGEVDPDLHALVATLGREVTADRREASALLLAARRPRREPLAGAVVPGGRTAAPPTATP
jgi:hypothetical protein